MTPRYVPFQMGTQCSNPTGRPMLNSPLPPNPQDLDDTLRGGPWGAVALCGVAVGLVIAIWFLFYWLAFLPRGLAS